MKTQKLTPFRLKPTIRNYVWGGRSLKMLASPEQAADEQIPIAEAWIVYEDNTILDGDFAGQTLKDVAFAQGEALLGSKGDLQQNRRFQVLIKILDCARWLSVQVHPDNELAHTLEGPGFNGKTEAWYVLGVEEGAELISGVKEGVTPERLRQAIQDGSILDVVARYPLKKNDLILVEAGTVHALGPGQMVYEVQQTSDLTYRVYDWGRPQTPERHLHIEQSLASARARVVKPQAVEEDEGRSAQRCLVDCPYFHLERLISRGEKMEFDTGGLSFHALTVIEGQAEFTCRDYHAELSLYDTVLVPAVCGSYELRGNFRMLKASMV